MAVLPNIAKVYAARRLLTFLTKDIDKLNAFKLGVIDATGKQIIPRKDMTQQQKDSFGPFEKICIWVRRVLKNHGVAQMAVALTYLEEKKYDEFIVVLKECVRDEMNESFDPVASSKPDVDPSILLDVLNDQNRKFQFQADDTTWTPVCYKKPKDDFWSNVMLVEALEEILCGEDAPTTSTTGIASYDTPLGARKRRDEDLEEEV